MSFDVAAFFALLLPAFERRRLEGVAAYLLRK